MTGDSLLYAVQFRSSVVKIGISQNPAVRFRALRSKYGAIERSFVTDFSVTGRAAEQMALRAAARIASAVIGTETFLGLKFGEAKCIISQAASRYKASNMVRGWVSCKGVAMVHKKGVVCIKVAGRDMAIDIAKLERWALRVLREEAFGADMAPVVEPSAQESA